MEIADLRLFFCRLEGTGCCVTITSATRVQESAKLLYRSLNVIDITIYNTILCGLPISFKTLNHISTDAKGTLINYVNRHLERINVQKLDN